MIDEDGYRHNVGIIITNQTGQLLWARRCNKKDAWQFPQGGINDNETPEIAMYRELTEELGLLPEAVEIVAQSQNWWSYRLPIGYWRLDSQPLVIGQKQKWFLLRLLADESLIDLNLSARPEFDRWAWTDYWTPAEKIIAFKHDVYVNVLKEFEPIVKNLVIESSNG